MKTESGLWLIEFLFFATDYIELQKNAETKTVFLWLQWQYFPSFAKGNFFYLQQITQSHRKMQKPKQCFCGFCGNIFPHLPKANLFFICHRLHRATEKCINQNSVSVASVAIFPIICQWQFFLFAEGKSFFYQRISVVCLAIKTLKISFNKIHKLI
jgi:hypothetical protein